MPKLSGDTLLQRAIPRAIEDRVSFLDAIGEDSTEAPKVRGAIADLRALRGVSLSSMSMEQRKLSFSAFVWAEQWHLGVADAYHRTGRVAREALSALNLLRAYRLANMGMTTLEAATQNASSIDLRAHAAGTRVGNRESRRS